MNETLVNNFYEVTGYIQAYSGYFILLPFLLRWKRLTTSPYHFYFVNLIISMIFDGFSMYFHYKQIMLSYFDIIVPFYALNNVIFWGMFFTFHIKKVSKMYVHISIFISALTLLAIYLIMAFEELYPWGYLLQLVLLTIYVLIGIKSVLLTQVRIPNKKPFLIICVSLLVTFLSSMMVYIFLQKMLEVSATFMHLFYGIGNVISILCNLLSAYAIFLVFPPKFNRQLNFIDDIHVK